MRVKRSNEQFIKDLLEKNEHFKLGKFKVLEEYRGLKYKILLEDDFGECRILTHDLLYNNYKPRIESAVDKDLYFKNRANKIHSYRYDYQLSKYINYKLKLIIKCNKHGEFQQTPNNHWKGKGCPICGNLDKSNYQKKNPTGWSLTNWKNKGEISNKFDSFKVYIVRCFNENEEFFKIGRTFNSVNNRLKTSSSLPYTFEIIKTYEGEAKEMFKLETKLKKMNKKNKYIPNLKFDGMFECFSQLDANTILYIGQ